MLALVVVSAILYLQVRERVSPSLSFWLVVSTPLAVAVLGSYYFSVQLVAQPGRFHLGLDLAIAGLLGTLLGATKGISRRISYVAVMIVVVAGYAEAYRHQRAAVRRIDIAKTSDFQVSDWLRRNATPGDRAMLPGSLTFWLNAFSELSQVQGCCEQTQRIHLPEYVQYVFHSDDGVPTNRLGEADVEWFRFLGVRWVVSCGKKSTEAYHAMRNPGKFEGRLQSVWRNETDDEIYEIPLGARASFAHVLFQGELPDRHPIHGLDTAAVEKTSAAIGDPRRLPLRLEKAGPGDYRVTAKFEPGQILYTRTAYHPGWTASAGGRAFEVKSDKLGLLYVEPPVPGLHAVHLVFKDRERELLVAVCAIAVAGHITAVLVWLRHRSRT
jgi:hypothetical protein